jgi:hypothetical protein
MSVFVYLQLTQGFLPFDGASAFEIQRKILNDPVPLIKGKFSDALKKTINQMLIKVRLCIFDQYHFYLIYLLCKYVIFFYCNCIFFFIF